jgi:hypothetical protein
MTSERSGAMMIFAVHIVGNSTADCDKPGTGHYRQKPAARNADLQNFSQRHTRLTVEDAALYIESDKSIESSRADLRSVAIYTTVAVTATQTKCQRGVTPDKVR